jgi:hypothetical protein
MEIWDRLRKLWAILFSIILLISLLGCNGTPAPTSTSTPVASSSVTNVPNASQNTSPATIRELIDHSEKYAGQTLSLTGTIALECPEGCWFFLDDGTAKIYVDLKPAGLTIPQKVGSRVILRGKTQGSGGNLQILGDEVKFPDEVK